MTARIQNTKSQTAVKSTFGVWLVLSKIERSPFAEPLGVCENLMSLFWWVLFHFTSRRFMANYIEKIGTTSIRHTTFFPQCITTHLRTIFAFRVSCRRFHFEVILMAILAVCLFLLWYFYPTICQWWDEMLDMPLSDILKLLMFQTSSTGRVFLLPSWDVQPAM